MRQAGILTLMCCTLAIAEQKSVLFIAVDDLRPEHGVYGGRALTPNIDEFAKTATVFNRNYVQIGVCSPSRTSLLTGRYPDTTHVTDLWYVCTLFTTESRVLCRDGCVNLAAFIFRHYFRESGCNVTTLPQAFLNQGFFTRGSSKIFHPGHASGAGDNRSSYPCGPSCSGYNDPPSWGGYFEPPSQMLSPWNITNGLSWMALNETEYPVEMHPDVQSAMHIAGLISSLANTTTPFFLAAGTLKPHLPFIFPARFLEPYVNYDELAADAAAASDEAIASWTAWGAWIQQWQQ
jgi:iduronate 2-sulfatase